MLSYFLEKLENILDQIDKAFAKFCIIIPQAKHTYKCFLRKTRLPAMRGAKFLYHKDLE